MLLSIFRGGLSCLAYSDWWADDDNRPGQLFVDRGEYTVFPGRWLDNRYEPSVPERGVMDMFEQASEDSWGELDLYAHFGCATHRS